MIPTATTTITVRTGVEAEPGEGRTFTTTATGVRAVIGSPSGSERTAPGGGRSIVGLTLTCDPCVLSHLDQVIDETTDLTYEVVWPAVRNGFGLDHVTAKLTDITGIVR